MTTVLHLLEAEGLTTFESAEVLERALQEIKLYVVQKHEPPQDNKQLP